MADNVTMLVHETDPFMGDIMLPLPIGEDGYTNMEDALADVKSLVIHYCSAGPPAATLICLVATIISCGRSSIYRVVLTLILTLGQVPPSANWTEKFNTVNYRYPLTLCTTEHVYFFTDSKSKDFQVIEAISLSSLFVSPSSPLLSVSFGLIFGSFSVGNGFC